MDKVAIILGTSSGIGLAFAKLLLERGFIVYGGSRSESSIDHENFIDLELDLTNPNQIKSFIKEVKADFEGVDLFLSTAGICEMSSISDTTELDLQNHFDINIKGAFNFLKAFEELLIPDETHIINLLSISAKSTFENTIGYTSSEHAKLAMLKIFEKEWKKYSPRFSYLFLGAVDSPLWDEYQDLDRSKMLGIEDVIFYLKTIIASPPHIKVHNLTITHESAFLE